MNIFFWKRKSQNPYPRSFARRLTWRIMITLFLVMGFISMIIVFISWAITITSITGICDRQLEYKAKSVEQVLTEVYAATVNTVPDIVDNLHRPERIEGIMKRLVELNPHIRSSGISFRENYYPQKGRWFCPYAQRSDSDSVVVMRLVASKDHDYLNEAWFLEGLKAKEGYWGDPFFDGQDHETPLVPLLMPIRDERDSTVAVLGVDLSLRQLAQEVTNMFFDGYGVSVDVASDQLYYFIIDSTGTFLVHPQKERIVHQNIAKMAQETADISDDYAARVLLEQGRRMGHFMTGERGEDLTINGERVMMNYTTLEHTPWKMVMVFPFIILKVVNWIIGGLLLFFILIGLLVVFFAGRRGIKKASRPLKQLAVSANEVAKGNFDTKLPAIRSRDEIHLLRDSFENMQQSLSRYVMELQETTAQKAAFESEMKVAHDIQMSMLPKTFPPYPERDDLDIFGSLTPAKGVGGDLFDFYIRDEQLFFCIGDVSGKGVPASLFMAVTRSLFRNISQHVAEPSEIVNALNMAQSEGNDTNMFVTLFVGVLDLTTGKLRYCNAGHDAPLLMGQEVKLLPCDSNLPIGVMADFSFEQQEITLERPTTLFLFTDGLNEAENIDHGQFGDERIEKIAESMVAAGQIEPTQVIRHMTDAVHTFVGTAEQSDDLTMLAIEYKKEGTSI